MIEVGRKLNGRYEILGNIGSGGMAHVFLAHDLILDREVAIKVLRFDFQNDQTAIRRFQREALAATELVHPNIVSVYDVGEENNMQYLVMEFVRGMDLKRYIQTQYPIPYQTVVDIMDQILAAVSLAHEHRIIHRDLKPQNVLMDEEGVVKIADFGIAIALSETSITQTNTMLGSVHYLSPEQARGSMATKQSDIYAMGIILYELLVGQVPFDGESAVTIALKHFQDDLPDIRDFNPNTPQSLINIVLHATAKDPADRYQTADEMQEDLATVLNPERLNEPRWLPSVMASETVAITPVKETAPLPTPVPEEVLPEDREEIPQPMPQKSKKKNNKKRNIIIGAAAALVLIFGGLLYAFGSGAPDVEVPDVNGLTVEAATSELEGAGLTVATDTIAEVSDEVDEDLVTRTNPEAGVQVAEGREITLYVSSGSGKIELKDYEDTSYSDARAELLALGFTANQIKKVEEDDDEIETGNVISQDPDAGTELDPEDRDVVITFTVSSGPEDVVLPDYTGWTYDSAARDIRDKELEVRRVDEQSNSIAAGNVISQDLTSAPPGSTVTLTVSSGPEQVTIRDYTGQSYDEASAALEALGISVESEEAFSDTVEEGNVISQTPGAGSVNAGSTVTLTVSKGPDPAEATVTVPNLVNRSQAYAESALGDLDLDSEITSREYSDTVLEGNVIRMSYASGTSVKVGTTIGLVISQGPDPSKTPSESSDQNND